MCRVHLEKGEARKCFKQEGNAGNSKNRKNETNKDGKKCLTKSSDCDYAVQELYFNIVQIHEII